MNTRTQAARPMTSEQALIAAYLAGESELALSNRLKISRKAIRRILSTNGVVIRDRAQAAYLRATGQLAPRLPTIGEIDVEMPYDAERARGLSPEPSESWGWRPSLPLNITMLPDPGLLDYLRREGIAV